MAIRRTIIAALALWATACVPSKPNNWVYGSPEFVLSHVRGPGRTPIYIGVTSPSAWQTGTATDAVGYKRARVRGEVCQSGLVLPLFAFVPSFAWGDNGFIAVRDKALLGRDVDRTVLTDVRFDVETTSVLGIYVQECLVMNAEAWDKISP